MPLYHDRSRSPSPEPDTCQEYGEEIGMSKEDIEVLRKNGDFKGRAEEMKLGCIDGVDLLPQVKIGHMIDHDNRNEREARNSTTRNVSDYLQSKADEINERAQLLKIISMTGHPGQYVAHYFIKEKGIDTIEKLKDAPNMGWEKDAADASLDNPHPSIDNAKVVLTSIVNYANQNHVNLANFDVADLANYNLWMVDKKEAKEAAQGDGLAQCHSPHQTAESAKKRQRQGVGDMHQDKIKAFGHLEHIRQTNWALKIS